MINDNTDTNEVMNSFAASLAFDTKIDFESAQKVITWLVKEGVLDIPVVNETYTEEKTIVAA